jgi:hypothetical protein
MVALIFIVFLALTLGSISFLAQEIFADTLQIGFYWTKSEYQTYTVGFQLEHGKNGLPNVGSFKAKNYRYYTVSWLLFVGKASIKIRIFE